MRIAEIHIHKIDLPVKNGPYVMSGSEVHALDSTVVQIVTDSGLIGYGEVCPLASNYQPQHALGARAALCELAPSLIQQEPLKIQVLNHLMDSVLEGHNYAKAAIDIALWDLLGKHHDVRVCDLLGGALTETVPSYYAIGVTTPENAAEIAVEKVAQGYRRLQIKIGGRPVEYDIETLTKVYEAIGTDAQIVADGNRGMLSKDVVLFSRACKDIPMAIEQACNSITELVSIRPQLAHPIYIDENSEDLSVVIEAAGKRLCDGFGLKLSRLGGISKLRTARDICAAQNIPHTCDDSWGGDIIAAACVHMGATVTAKLNEGVWIAEPYIDGHYDEDKPIKVEGGSIKVPTGPGLGVTPNPDKLGPAVHSF
jgi:L-alanine-DL-glutamate epimerase-like enolase superfamily enzyme